MKIGWFNDGHADYYSMHGKMLTGWQLIENSWFYLSPSGAKLNGWQY